MDKKELTTARSCKHPASCLYTSCISKSSSTNNSKNYFYFFLLFFRSIATEFTNKFRYVLLTSATVSLLLFIQGSRLQLLLTIKHIAIPLSFIIFNLALHYSLKCSLLCILIQYVTYALQTQCNTREQRVSQH